MSDVESFHYTEAFMQIAPELTAVLKRLRDIGVPFAFVACHSTAKLRVENCGIVVNRPTQSRSTTVDAVILTMEHNGSPGTKELLAPYIGTILRQAGEVAMVEIAGKVQQEGEGHAGKD